MNYFPTQDGSRAEFDRIIQDQVAVFTANALCRRCDQGKLKMGDYHALLSTIFHQVFNSSSTFALAASWCDRPGAREYLMHHAEEEKTHWQWILNDLKATGYAGPKIEAQFPKHSAAAYIAFNYYIAQRFPLGRLAIAAMLESLGASFGKQYAGRICKELKLKPGQATFFFGHGDTDVGHTAEILEVIEVCKLTALEWGWMCFAARTAGQLYFGMYDEIGHQVARQDQAA